VCGGKWRVASLVNTFWYLCFKPIFEKRLR
jgi:hypothetical protein